MFYPDKYTRAIYYTTLLIFLTSIAFAMPEQTRQILLNLAQYDGALHQGTVTYTYSSSLGKESRQIYYDSSGHYHEINTGSPHTSKEIIFDGHDNLCVFTFVSPIEVQFNSYSQVKDIDRMISYYPGPCFAIGRGLSSLANLSISTDSNGVHLSGIAPDKSIIAALLDANHGYVATHINRIVNGKSVADWRLSNPKRFDNSPFIATDAVYTIGREIDGRYTILDANFNTPDQASLCFNWHKPGLQIDDMRLNDPVIYKSESLPAGITSSQLLDKTRLFLKDQQRIAAKETATTRSFHEQIASHPIMLILLLFGAIITVILGVILRRARIANKV